jgi:hypothetical protein
MTGNHPSLSDRQLKTAETLSRLEAARSTRRMAWVLFWVLVGLFVINSGLLIYSAFSQYADKITKSVMLAFDGLFGTLLTRVVWHLFPRVCKDKDGIVREIAPSKKAMKTKALPG